MQLKTLAHRGRRVSYYGLVQIALTDWQGTDAHVRDESGLWSATVEVDDRLKQRMKDDQVAYFWARIRGGEIDLHDREHDPEWEGDE